MKRNGFTLAELLIVLGITGVIAAVILPAINGLMPDKTKINYLKVYDELGKNIKALTADSTIFPIMLQYGDDDIDVSNIPLLNNTKPLKSPYNDDKYSGDKKLCNLIAFSVGVNDSCKETSYPETPSFTTSNGMQWWIRQTKREINTTESKASYQTDIYVDVDSSKKSSDCMYGEENCKNPDRFKFLLAADGTLVPADPVGLHYINSRKNLLKKKFKPEGEVLASLNDTLLNTVFTEAVDTHFKPQEPEDEEKTENENKIENNNNENNSGFVDYFTSYKEEIPAYITFSMVGNDLTKFAVNASIPHAFKPQPGNTTRNLYIYIEITGRKENNSLIILYNDACRIKEGETSCQTDTQNITRYLYDNVKYKFYVSIACYSDLYKGVSPSGLDCSGKDRCYGYEYVYNSIYSILKFPEELNNFYLDLKAPVRQSSRIVGRSSKRQSTGYYPLDDKTLYP